MDKVELKLEKNEKYGDWRIAVYVNDEWVNEVDNNYTKKQAERKKASLLNPNAPVGIYL